MTNEESNLTKQDWKIILKEILTIGGMSAALLGTIPPPEIGIPIIMGGILLYQIQQRHPSLLFFLTQSLGITLALAGISFRNDNGGPVLIIAGVIIFEIRKMMINKKIPTDSNQ